MVWRKKRKEAGQHQPTFHWSASSTMASRPGKRSRIWMLTKVEGHGQVADGWTKERQQAITLTKIKKERKAWPDREEQWQAKQAAISPACSSMTLAVSSVECGSGFSRLSGEDVSADEEGGKTIRTLNSALRSNLWNEDEKRKKRKPQASSHWPKSDLWIVGNWSAIVLCHVPWIVSHRMCWMNAEEEQKCKERDVANDKKNIKKIVCDTSKKFDSSGRATTNLRKQVSMHDWLTAFSLLQEKQNRRRQREEEKEEALAANKKNKEKNLQIRERNSLTFENGNS